MWAALEKAALVLLTVVAVVVIASVLYVFQGELRGNPIGRPEFMIANVQITCPDNDRQKLKQLIAVISLSEGSQKLAEAVERRLNEIANEERQKQEPEVTLIKRPGIGYRILDKYANARPDALPSTGDGKNFVKYFGKRWIAYYRDIVFDPSADELIPIPVPTMYVAEGDAHHTTRLFGAGELISSAEDAVNNQVLPKAELIFQVDFRPTVPKDFRQSAEMLIQIEGSGTCRINPLPK